MKKLITLTIAICVLGLNAISQNAKPNFLNKENQHSLSIEYTALSYSYAHSFNKGVTFGVRTQFGLGLPVLLTATQTYVDYGYGDGPEKITPIGSSWEVLKFQIFYRHVIAKSLYFDVGPVASICLGGEAPWEQPFRVGIETSVFYTIGRFNIGIRLDGSYDFGINQQHPNIEYNTSYYALYLTPIVIGFNF